MSEPEFRLRLQESGRRAGCAGASPVVPPQPSSQDRRRIERHRRRARRRAPSWICLVEFHARVDEQLDFARSAGHNFRKARLDWPSIATRTASPGTETPPKFRAGCAGSTQNRSRFSRSTAPISAARFAGFRNRGSSCVHAMEARSMRTDRMPRVRRRVDCSNIEHKVESGELKVLGGHLPTLAEP